MRAGKPCSGAAKPRPGRAPVSRVRPTVAEAEAAEAQDRGHRARAGRDRGRRSGHTARRTPPSGPYQTLFMEAPEAYVVTSADGTVIDLNRHAERLYKSRRARLLGRHVTELADMDREEYARRDAAMQVDGQATFMGLGRRTDGSAFAQQITIRRVVVEGERATSSISATRPSPTGSRPSSSRRRRWRPSASSSPVPRTSSTTRSRRSSGSAACLSSDPALPAELREDAALLVVEATRTRRIVENLLDFARQRPPERYPTKLGLARPERPRPPVVPLLRPDRRRGRHRRRPAPRAARPGDDAAGHPQPDPERDPGDPRRAGRGHDPHRRARVASPTRCRRASA